ncbi:MAG TPA: vitamin K epoxide reductase family protein [Candidatus Eisenbacteria bacterium]|nr:vitamin K epoxide reductase family protein [Candidatus Eisenbacteria bacterium]
MEGYSLKKFFTSPFPVRILPYLLLIFAVLGFLDATYLTIQHYAHSIPPCTVGGCETVLTSTWAVLFGVPVALMGAVFYGVVLVLTGIYLTLSNKQYAISNMLFLLCSLGFLVGIGLILVQAFVLHAWCYYCLFSELIDFLLFDTAWWLHNSQKSS